MDDSWQNTLILEQGQAIQTQLFSRFHNNNMYVCLGSSPCTRSNINTASNLKLLVYALSNNGNYFSDSRVLPIGRNFYITSNCSDECTAVGVYVRVMFNEGWLLPIYLESMYLTTMCELIFIYFLFKHCTYNRVIMHLHLYTYCTMFGTI